MTRREVGGGRRDGETTGRGMACRALDLDWIEIQPEPTPEEREAIVTALCCLTNTRVNESMPRTSPWAAAGKEEALLGRKGGVRQSLGRRDRRLAGW